MTTLARVVTELEVSINGSFYKLTRPVQSTLASQYPARVLTGEISGDSQARLSQIRWSNAQGGIGKKDHEGTADVDRIWYGTSHLRVAGHRTLPDKVTTTSASGVSGIVIVGAMAELANAVYAAFNTSIRKYAIASDSWGSSLHTLPAVATDAITVRLGGTVYMIFATTSGMTYTTDGSTFTDVTPNATHLAKWDDRIWAIDATGQLRWAFDPTDTWTDDAQLPLEDDNARDLFVARDAGGEHILYASTRVGLFAHDAANNSFVQTEMELPFHADSGQGVARWRDSTYIPAGLAIYKYSLGGVGAVITTVGPDKDQGLPADRRGKIVRLEPTHNDLVAMVESTSTSTIDTHASAGMATHQSPAIAPDTGISTVLGWNEVGWTVLHETETATEVATTALVSNAYGGYRFWFAHNRRIKYFTLPVDVVNPSEITDRVYADASRDEFPWFDASQAEVDKLAVRLKVETANCTTNETLRVYYGLNYDDDTWTALDAITTNGIHTFTFPNTKPGVITSATGLEFEAIRFRVDMVNGSDDSLSPDLRSLTLEYRKKLPPRFGWSFELDLHNQDKGQTVKEQRENLLTAINSNPRVEMTFRDDKTDVRNVYVDVIQLTGLENTGHNETGITRLVVAEL